jgi:hypothetical protein
MTFKVCIPSNHRTTFIAVVWVIVNDVTTALHHFPPMIDSYGAQVLIPAVAPSYLILPFIYYCNQNAKSCQALY